MKRKSINITQNLYNNIKAVKGENMADKLRVMYAFYITHSTHTEEVLKEELKPMVADYMNKHIEPYITKTMQDIEYKAIKSIEQLFKGVKDR